MIQRTFDVRNESELQWLVDMKFFSDYANAKTIFVQIYLSRFSADDAQKVLAVVHRELPKAKIVGMSLYGDPFVGLNAEKLMRFNFCFFDDSEVTILDYDGEKMAMNEIVADFRKHLDQLPDAKGVLLLGSGVTFKASRLMDAVTAGHENIPFFGSIANINTADVDDQAPFAFGNNMVRNGIAVAIFSGKNLHFYSESLFSWNPIGKEMLVEAGEPGLVGDSVIRKIDGAPAVQIYKKYLNVDPDAHFISNICEFPIVVRRNGYLMPRVPCGFNDAGELNTMGDVRDGEYIRFTYGKASEILGKTEEASRRMCDFAPEGIFLYACANRAIFLKACAHEEIDFYSRIVQNLVYCHGFSELYRFNGQGGVFNSQLVTIGLREGDTKRHDIRKPIIPGISFGNPRRTHTHSHAHPDFAAESAGTAYAHGSEPHTHEHPQSDAILGGGDAMLRDSAQLCKNPVYDNLADAGDKAIASAGAGGGNPVYEQLANVGDLAGLPRSVMSELNRREAENFTRNMLQWSDSERERLEWSEATASGRLAPNAPHSEMQLSEFQHSIGVAIPISERLVTFLEATTNELRDATIKANAANEAKSAFLSNMSHEIRSPINAVLGLDEMILRETGEDTIKSYARDIQSSGKSLLSIINDILDFSKIEAGKMEIIEDDYDLRSTITDLANMIEARALDKGLSFLVQIDETMPHLLHGDETRIKQCALNILTNAVKYTREGSVTLTVGIENGKWKMENAEGEVSPSLQPASQSSATPSPRGDAPKTPTDTIRLKISVADTGIGIKEEDLEKLFKPFERIEENRNRSIEGTGLGMSIVNGLLSQMGTELSVKSEYGKGSEFSFVLEQRVRDWEAIGTREEARAALMQEAPAYSESFQAPDAKILVIDDTPVNLTVFKGLLKNTRVQIDTAGSGAEALELVRNTEYHMLFVDHLMPKMDGLEFLAANFADSTSINKNTPAIALTANAVSGAKEMYLSAGFDDYLSKPIDPKKLEEMIRNYLPKELLILPGDADFVEAPQNGWSGEERREKVCEVSGLFGDIFALDIEAGLKNCGGKEVFKEAVHNFYDSIEEKSKLIEGYAESADWKNYTILVHALKSSARLIGATELSELAKELEAAGDKAQTENGKLKIENVAGKVVLNNTKSPDSDNSVSVSGLSAASSIREKTPAMLSLYRAYSAKLAPLVGKSVSEGSTTSAGNVAAKPEISHEQFADALSALREVVSAFDFDTADSIIAELDGYALPADYAEQFSKIRKAVRDVDQAAALALL